MPFYGDLKIYPVTLIRERPRSDIECGGKIVLPPTVLDVLTSRTNVLSAPMLFKMTNTSNRKFTHCGVLEFIAEESCVHSPSWVMDLLEVKCGYMVRVESVTLPVATFSRFQPQSVSFLDITNPKAVLENYLRNFSCLTVGDIIPIHYNEKEYKLKVEETKPSNAVSIVECDINVEFSPPVGYVSPQRSPPPEESVSTDFRPFSGSAQRLDGKKFKQIDPIQEVEVKRGIPDYDYKIGTIEFFRNSNDTKAKVEKQEKDFKAFQGRGKTLD